MNKTNSKKRGIIADTFLLTAIFSIFLTIIFFTFVNKKTVEEADVEKSGSITENIIPANTSEKTESNSPFTHIKIMTDISNDPYTPFAIQYPITSHENVNDFINELVQKEKDTYLNEMYNIHTKYDERIVGELNISFETFEYEGKYYSFLLQKIRAIPGKNLEQENYTFVMNQDSGELLAFSNIFQNNEESLVSLASHIKSLIEQDERFKHIDKSLIENTVTPKWSNFNNFVIFDEQITFYFNNLLDRELKEPLSIAIPFSSINSSLDEQFQIQMEEEEKPEVEATQTDKKYVALTFDDGPHPDVTPIIINILEKYNAKATFFMLGSRVQYYPDITNLVYEHGHEIGNHSWNHPILTNMTDAQILKEYTTTEQAITQAIGVAPTIFRPPYGATNNHIKSLIPIPQYNWTVDTLDWKYRNADMLLTSVQEAVHPNAIILMHDIHESTANGLEAVLQYLQQEGYEFVTVSELMSKK